MSNMLRSSSSDDEIRGQEGENSPNPQIVERVNVLMVGTNHSPNGSNAMNNNFGAWLPYGLLPRYTPLIVTQGLTSLLYSMVQSLISKCVC